MEEFEENKPKIEGFRISRLQYLLHLIMSHKQDKHPRAWSVLNMVIMLEVVPRAHLYMNFLADHGIIERKNYSIGRNSTLYRIIDEGEHEFRILTDPDLLRRIEKSKQKIRLRNSKKHPPLNSTIKQVEIDREGSLAYIEEEYVLNIKKNDAIRDKLDPKKYEEEKQHFLSRRNFLIAEVEKISAGDIYIKVNGTNFRLDSNFTHLPSELSEFLSLNGSPIVEIDLVNSQPFFAAALLNPKPEVKKVIKKYLGDSFTMLPVFYRIHGKEDVQLYTKLVCNGQFYEFMAERFHEAGIPYKNRKDLKKQLFVVFFGKNISYKYNPAAEIFRSNFPNVFRLFYKIKEDGHNRLAILLQRIESHIMLDLVVSKISEEFPEIRMLTKHDSVLPFRMRTLVSTSKYNTFEIGKAMLDVIENATGLRPKGNAKRFPKKNRD